MTSVVSSPSYVDRLWFHVFYTRFMIIMKFVCYKVDPEDVGGYGPVTTPLHMQHHRKHFDETQLFSNQTSCRLKNFETIDWCDQRWFNNQQCCQSSLCTTIEIKIYDAGGLTTAFRTKKFVMQDKNWEQFVVPRIFSTALSFATGIFW
jgi:hypothetical protein